MIFGYALYWTIFLTVARQRTFCTNHPNFAFFWHGLTLHWKVPFCLYNKSPECKYSELGRLKFWLLFMPAEGILKGTLFDFDNIGSGGNPFQWNPMGANGQVFLLFDKVFPVYGIDCPFHEAALKNLQWKTIVLNLCMEWLYFLFWNNWRGVIFVFVDGQSAVPDDNRDGFFKSFVVFRFRGGCLNQDDCVFRTGLNGCSDFCQIGRGFRSIVCIGYGNSFVCNCGVGQSVDDGSCA